MTRSRTRLPILAGLLATALGCGGGSGGGDEVSTPEGVWDGTYTESGDSSTHPYQLLLLADGTARVREGVTKISSAANGTWTRSGDTVTVTYSTYLISFALGDGTASGTWGFAPLSTDGGDVAFTKATSGPIGAWSAILLSSDVAFMIFWPAGDLEAWQDGTTIKDFAPHAGTWALDGTTLTGESTFFCGADFEVTLATETWSGDIDSACAFIGTTLFDGERVH
jgi:hypothetical protein